MLYFLEILEQPLPKEPRYTLQQHMKQRWIYTDRNKSVVQIYQWKNTTVGGQEKQQKNSGATPPMEILYCRIPQINGSKFFNQPKPIPKEMFRWCRR